MGNYIKQSTARKCPVHMACMNEAATRLVNVGAFSKNQVIEHLGLAAMSEAIRWDYISDWLKAEYECELVPMVSRFFRNTKEETQQGWTPQKNPEKYIASGHGKKTAGYAAVGFTDELNGVYLERLKQKRKLTNGVGKAFDKYVAEVKRRGILLPAGEAVELLKAVNTDD